MRQIHAAIEHWRRGDFECAITLAGAADAMLHDIDELHSWKMKDAVRAYEISNWLAHGTGADVDAIVIEEIDTVAVIHRAILKFEAAFSQDKTPQMTSFRNYVLTQKPI